MEKQQILRTFLEIPYEELEKINLKAISDSFLFSQKELEEKYREYLNKEKGIKAITVCFSDIEGRFHMLDYDKNHLLSSSDNLTFDGSSIRGFSKQSESDLILEIDWPSIRWLPSDIFGPGKIIVFAFVKKRDNTYHPSDFRSRLRSYTEEIKKTHDIEALLSAEIEGFLVNNINAEESYTEEKGFEFISASGYYHSLPMDKLRYFIDRVAEAQRAMGFKNEKDHPEVAPSQFELNFSYSEALKTCDNIQIYKLICRQIANTMGITSTFLPKPFPGINGNGMHINLSLKKENQNIFFKKNGINNLSPLAWDAVNKILNHASELSLIFNSSVNSYRRLDSKFEAPNQIKVSAIDRSSMIRIPISNEKGTRIEIRSIAPDANPYMTIYSILKTIYLGEKPIKDEDKRNRLRYLPDNINDAIKIFKASNFIDEIIGSETKEKYTYLKQKTADRSPKELGSKIKKSEIIFHHEITNQLLWNEF